MNYIADVLSCSFGYPLQTMIRNVISKYKSNQFSLSSPINYQLFSPQIHTWVSTILLCMMCKEDLPPPPTKPKSLPGSDSTAILLTLKLKILTYRPNYLLNDTKLLFHLSHSLDEPDFATVLH